MRLIEDRSEREGVSKNALMEHAGLGIARVIRDRVGRVPKSRVIVLVGAGNNGGDGLVASRHLHNWGFEVQVFLCGKRREGDSNLQIIKGQGVCCVDAFTGVGLDALKLELEYADIVLDSVLGIGLSRPIQGLLKQVLTTLAEVRRKRPELRLFAVDIPTGMDADTGKVDALCVAADITMALGYPKVGLYQFPGAEFSGLVQVVDIGLPDSVEVDSRLELITRNWARTVLPTRPRDAHKGTFGRTLVVAGSLHYFGAAYLSGTAAGRVGAGLVTLAIPQSLQTAIASKAVEPTYLPLPESSYGLLSPDAANIILDVLPQFQSLLIGPGMGTGVDRVLEVILCSGKELPPTVVDADGLNFLAGSRGDRFVPWWHKFSNQTVLTPHPGEAARLASVTINEIQANRVESSLDWARKWNKVIVLKGAHTVVASPKGRGMISPFSNPGLATAGTGDVLAGVIAGLLSQNLSLVDAAALGVFLHGLAGEIVTDDLGDTGMVASDLLPAIPKAVKKIRD